MVASLPEIPLADGSIAIADLHLDLAARESVEPFAGWLAALDPVPALVVLGDLFDVWVGPAQARLPGAPPVLDALRGLTRRGARVIVVPGNRDFLLDAAFEERTGAEVHPRGILALAGTTRALLVHGDELCSLDRGYQRLRKVVRSRPVTWLAPRLPLPVSARIARGLRRASTRAVAAKPPLEKSMQASAARALAAAHAADVLVCGHAHAFQDLELEPGRRWIVLDAFGGERDLLAVGPAGRLDVLCAHTDPRGRR